MKTILIQRRIANYELAIDNVNELHFLLTIFILRGTGIRCLQRMTAGH